MNKNWIFLPLVLLLSIICVKINAQNVGINEPNPDNSALLEMTSSERGLLVPRMTEVERDAIASPANGLMIYNLNDSCINIYRANYWYSMCNCDGSEPIPPMNCNGVVTDVVDVTNTFTGDTWMDRNLGASQQAIAHDDYLAYGSLYQWGRLTDGHECIVWTSSTSSDGAEQNAETSTLSSTDVPGHGDCIVGNTANWRSPSNNNLWQGVNGVNNPCPSGYRIPTEVEINNERLSWVQAPISSTNDHYGAFASPLKLVTAGWRSCNAYSGDLVGTGTLGYCWSSTTISSIGAIRLSFNSNGASAGGAEARIAGMSVRCIKD